VSHRRSALRGWTAPPESTTRLADPARLATELALFVSAGAAPAATTSLVLGLGRAGWHFGTDRWEDGAFFEFDITAYELLPR
jgi:Spy/CpxP family protein refolding chaperone